MVSDQSHGACALHVESKIVVSCAPKGAASNAGMTGFYEKDIHYHNVIANEYDCVVVQPRAVANDLAFARFDDLIPTGGRMLDLGCGTGHMLLRYASRFESVRGVDHSHGMLAEASRLLAAARIKHVELTEAALMPWLEAEQSRFDLITAVGVLHHQPHEELGRLMGLIRERMHEGSTLLIAEPLAGLEEKPPRWLERWNQQSHAARLTYSEHPEDPDEAPVDFDTLKQSLSEGRLKIARFERGTEVFPRNAEPSWRDKLVAKIATRLYSHRGHIGFVAARPA